MPGASDFAKMVPGFDFLQSLMKGAGAGLPGMGQWIAPTLDPDELSKRIEQLRTVQFWLEQNARMLGTTVQALEVQRMTLSTLKTMNVPMAELRKSMEIQPETAAAEAAPAAASKKASAAADPMQWWGALTKQFGEIAAGAMKEAASAMPAAAPAAKKAAPAKKTARKRRAA
jgi:hypothetical protein